MFWCSSCFSVDIHRGEWHTFTAALAKVAYNLDSLSKPSRRGKARIPVTSQSQLRKRPKNACRPDMELTYDPHRSIDYPREFRARDFNGFGGLGWLRCRSLFARL